jgi:hypothetical protein
MSMKVTACKICAIRWRQVQERVRTEDTDVLEQLEKGEDHADLQNKVEELREMKGAIV